MNTYEKIITALVVVIIVLSILLGLKEIRIQDNERVNEHLNRRIDSLMVCIETIQGKK